MVGPEAVRWALRELPEAVRWDLRQLLEAVMRWDAAHVQPPALVGPGVQLAAQRLHWLQVQ